MTRFVCENFGRAWFNYFPFLWYVNPMFWHCENSTRYGWDSQHKISSFTRWDITVVWHRLLKRSKKLGTDISKPWKEYESQCIGQVMLTFMFLMYVVWVMLCMICASFEKTCMLVMYVFERPSLAEWQPYHSPFTLSSDKSEEQIEEEEQDQFWGC